MVPLVDNFDGISDEEFTNWMNRVAEKAPKLNEGWAKVAEAIISELAINTESHNMERAVENLILLREQCRFIRVVKDSNTEINYILGVNSQNDTGLLKKMMVAAHHFWRQAYFGVNQELDIDKAGIFDQTEINLENKYFENKVLVNEIYDEDDNLKPNFNAQEFINSFAANPELSSLESFTRMLRLGQLLSDSGITDAIALDANIEVVEVIIENYENYLRSIGKMDLADRFSGEIGDNSDKLENV